MAVDKQFPESQAENRNIDFIDFFQWPLGGVLADNFINLGNMRKYFFDFFGSNEMISGFPGKKTLHFFNALKVSGIEFGLHWLLAAIRALETAFFGLAAIFTGGDSGKNGFFLTSTTASLTTGRWPMFR